MIRLAFGLAVVVCGGCYRALRFPAAVAVDAEVRRLRGELATARASEARAWDAVGKAQAREDGTRRALVDCERMLTARGLGWTARPSTSKPPTSKAAA